MLRSISAVALATALLGAAPAHAGWWSNFRSNQQQRRQPVSNTNDVLKKQKAQSAQNLLRKTQDDSRQQARATDESTRQLAKTTRQAAPRPESPFVRASRASVAWDTRGFGLTMHASSVGAQHSIYQRLHAAPMSIRDQLRLAPGPRGGSGLLARAMHSSTLEVASNRFDFGASNDRRREYRIDQHKSLFMAFKAN